MRVVEIWILAVFCVAAGQEVATLIHEVAEEEFSPGESTPALQFLIQKEKASPAPQTTKSDNGEAHNDAISPLQRKERDLHRVMEKIEVEQQQSNALQAGLESSGQGITALQLHESKLRSEIRETAGEESRLESSIDRMPTGTQFVQVKDECDDALGNCSDLIGDARKQCYKSCEAELLAEQMQFEQEIKKSGHKKAQKKIKKSGHKKAKKRVKKSAQRDAQRSLAIAKAAKEASGALSASAKAAAAAVSGKSKKAGKKAGKKTGKVAPKKLVNATQVPAHYETYVQAQEELSGLLKKQEYKLQAETEHVKGSDKMLKVLDDEVHDNDADQETKTVRLQKKKSEVEPGSKLGVRKSKLHMAIQESEAEPDMGLSDNDRESRNLR